MALHNEVIGEFTPDRLIANIHVKTHTQSVTVAAGQGTMKRGTVVALDGTEAKTMATGLTPHGVLCNDVDATEAAVAEVYVTGCFNKGALIVAEGYELTAADVLALRNGGIFVENVME